MGRRKTVSNPAGPPSDPIAAHIPTPNATNQSPPPGDTPSPGPGDIDALSKLLEGGDAESQTGSAPPSPLPDNPASGDTPDFPPPGSPASTPRIPTHAKGKRRAPPSRTLSPIPEANPSRYAEGVSFPPQIRSPSPQPRPPAIPRGLVRSTPGPSDLAGALGATAPECIPQVLGKRPSPAPGTDEGAPLI